jgi:hypothetical protein
MSISDITFTERFIVIKRLCKNEKKIKMKKFTEPRLVAHLYLNKPPTTCQGFLRDGERKRPPPEAHGLFFGKR